MSTPEPSNQDRGAVAGYHVYWTSVDPYQVKDTDELLIRQGFAPGGKPLVVDPNTYLETASAQLAPGYYRFIPVDHDGRELPDLPSIDQQLAVDPKILDARSLTFEEEVLGRILLGSQEHADVAKAVELAGGEEGCRRLIDDIVSHHPRFAGRPLREALDLDWFAVQHELVNLTLEAIDHVANEDPGSFRLDRVSLEALMHQPWSHHERHVRSALDRGDYNDAAVRALARIRRKQAIAPELLLEILVGMNLKAGSSIVLIARGVPGELLGERLRRGAFGARTEDIERGICAALVVWQTVPPEVARPLLVPFLRRAARRQLSMLSATAGLNWLTKQVDDPHLRELYARRQDILDEELLDFFGTSLADLCSSPAEDLIRLLPDQDADEIPGVSPARDPDAIQIRAPEKVGRNELCPCGSGKKFKRCCVDRTEAPRTQPARARPFRVTALRELAQRLAPHEVKQLPRSILAQLELDRLRKDSLLTVLQCHVYSRDWERARRARAEVARRCSVASADRLWQGAVYEAVRMGEYDLARQLFAELAHPEQAIDMALELAVSGRDAKALEVLETVAKAAVSGAGTAAVAVARAALHTTPALGLLLARGALADASAIPAAQLPGLLSEIEEVRDDLGLAPGDPARAMCGEREAAEASEQEDAERAQLVRTATELRGKVDATTRRIAELERQLAEQNREPVPGRGADKATSSRATHDAQQRVRQKEQRIDELEAGIRERNEELARYRRELAAVGSHGMGKSVASQLGTPQQGQDGDDAEAGMVEAGTADGGRRVLLPYIGGTAEASLDTVPRAIAAIAMRTLGMLAAGDTAAWRAVKQAKDMSTQLFMARIGIHHRMLFRVDQGRLEILDVITREGLKTALKRMRS